MDKQGKREKELLPNSMTKSIDVGKEELKQTIEHFVAENFENVSIGGVSYAVARYNGVWLNIRELIRELATRAPHVPDAGEEELEELVGAHLHDVQKACEETGYLLDSFTSDAIADAYRKSFRAAESRKGNPHA